MTRNAIIHMIYAELRQQGLEKSDAIATARRLAADPFHRSQLAQKSR